MDGVLECFPARSITKKWLTPPYTLSCPLGIKLACAFYIFSPQICALPDCLFPGLFCHRNECVTFPVALLRVHSANEYQILYFVVARNVNLHPLLLWRLPDAHCSSAIDVKHYEPECWRIIMPNISASVCRRAASGGLR